MGRYTTVQAYADNNRSMRSISYDQAVGTTNDSSKGGVRPEKVSNPYGATAGAGSGEFHLYRHARGRELMRLKAMDDEHDTKIKDLKFQSKVTKWKEEDDARTFARQKKRRRQKEARERKKQMKLGGINMDSQYEKDGYGGNIDECVSLPLHEPLILSNSFVGVRDKEAEKKDENIICDKKYARLSDIRIADEGKLPDAAFNNDGSFLKKAKKLFEAEKRKRLESDKKLFEEGNITDNSNDVYEIQEKTKNKKDKQSNKILEETQEEQKKVREFNDSK